jgi:uncharacterized membrane protein
LLQIFVFIAENLSVDRLIIVNDKMTIQSGRNLGGTGAALVALGAVTSVFTIIRYLSPNSATLNSALSSIGAVISLLSLIGFILFLAAMLNFSRAFSEHKIFHYLLYGIILNIIAGAIASMIMLAFSLADIARIYAVISPTEIPAYLLGSVSVFMPVFGLVSLLYLVFAVKALNLLGIKSQVRLFNTAGKVFLAGTVVQIVAGVTLAVWTLTNPVSLSLYSLVFVPSGLVQSVAWALLAKSFFKIPQASTQTIEATTANYSASYTVVGQTKYCIHCGASKSLDAVYCVRCGKKQ